tara:strand:+ start:5884 stop:6222 length:339 start_codon:yes stop_codon:yes gene_type:complete
MKEICYKFTCIIISLFIISLFCYQIIKSNYDIKLREGVELSSTDTVKMNSVKSDLLLLKTQQANIIKNIQDIKKETDDTTFSMKRDEKKITAAINKTKEDAENAKKGKISPE